MSKHESNRLSRFLENFTDRESEEFRASLRLFLEKDTEGAAWLRSARQVGLSRPNSPLMAWWIRSEARFVPMAMCALVVIYFACFLTRGIVVSAGKLDTSPNASVPTVPLPRDIRIQI